MHGTPTLSAVPDRDDRREVLDELDELAGRVERAILELDDLATSTAARLALVSWDEATERQPEPTVRAWRAFARVQAIARSVTDGL